MLTPVAQHQLTGILRSVHNCPRGVCADNITEPIGDLDLAVRAKQSAVVFRLPVQDDGVVSIRLNERDYYTSALFL